jgi:gas vesicle protein
MANQNRNKKTMIMGTMLGAIVGATSAFFLAPKSGKELRSDMKHHVDSAKDKTFKLKDTVKGSMNDVSTLVKDKSSTLSKEFINQAKQLLDKDIDRINKVNTEENVGLDDLKDVTKDLLKEELKSGKEVRNIVKEEMTDMKNKVSQDLADLKKEIQKEHQLSSSQ